MRARVGSGMQEDFTPAACRANIACDVEDGMLGQNNYFCCCLLHCTVLYSTLN